MRKGYTNVEESKFTSKTIVQEVKKNYGVNIVKVSKMVGGSANLFKVYTSSQIYVLKEFQKWYSRDIILKEVHVINHLRKKGINVPEYVRCLNGDFSFNNDGNEVVLQKYIEGTVKEPNTGSKKDLLETSRILGKIVNALEDYLYDDLGDFKKNIDTMFSKQKYEEAIKKCDDLISKTDDDSIIKDLKLKKKIIEDLLKKEISDDIRKITLKNSHGDYGIVQLIYGDGITVIDFATAMNLPICYEVIRSYSSVDKECMDGIINLDNLIIYIKEFMKYVKLNEYDLKYMAYIYMNKLATSSYGYKQYINYGNIDLLRFGQWRTRMCKYLFNNYKEIGDSLIKEIINK